jgi:predicted peroxiredoxin
MPRRKLIFFAAADTRTDPVPAWSAYHFATVATNAGLEVEVRLAGDAVRLAQPDGIGDTEQGDKLRRKVKESSDAAFLVSL